VSEAARKRFPWRPAALAALAWAIPSSGHFVLGKRGRGAIFLAVVACAIGIGAALEGNLYRPVPGQPLTALATLGAMGMGAPYFVLRWFLGYAGVPESASYEYGSVFLLSAGLMNLLLVLDVWDLATGRKE
jgi:hypothetical protein